MKKLFVSIPMLNRNVNVVNQNIKFMHQIACYMWNEDLDLINPHIDNIVDRSKLASWYFGEYLMGLIEADYFIGVDKDVSHLCNIERGLAEMFGLDVRLVDINNYNCFDDIGVCLDKLLLGSLYGKFAQKQLAKLSLKTFYDEFDQKPKISYYENNDR